MCVWGWRLKSGWVGRQRAHRIPTELAEITQLNSEGLHLVTLYLCIYRISYACFNVEMIRHFDGPSVKTIHPHTSVH